MRTCALLAVLGLLAAACAQAAISTDASAALRQHLTVLRSAVAAEDVAAAEASLQDLRAEADARAEDGDISDERLAEIEAAADDVHRFLDERQAAQPAPEPAPEDADDDGTGKGNGKGKGEDKDRGKGNGKEKGKGKGKGKGDG